MGDVAQDGWVDETDAPVTAPEAVPVAEIPFDAAGLPFFAPPEQASQRWPELAKLTRKLADLEGEHGRSQRHLDELLAALRRAEARDAEAYAERLVAGKRGEPDREADRVSAALAREERRNRALVTAITTHRGAVQALIEERRAGWRRDHLRELAHRHQRYLDAIDGLERARQEFADEAALGRWLTAPTEPMPGVVSDVLGGNVSNSIGAPALGLTAALAALRSDAQHIADAAAGRPLVARFIDWARVRKA